jgi:hypothetical protein
MQYTLVFRFSLIGPLSFPRSQHHHTYVLLLNFVVVMKGTERSRQ